MAWIIAAAFAAWLLSKFSNMQRELAVLQEQVKKLSDRQAREKDG